MRGLSPLNLIMKLLFQGCAVMFEIEECTGSENEIETRDNGRLNVIR